MKGTLISILVGALAGVLLTLGSSVHASHAAANRAAPTHSRVVTPAQAAVDPVTHPAEPAAASDEHEPLAR